MSRVICLTALVVVFVACSPAMQASDAGVDAGSPKASQSLGAMGGTLELEDLRLELPEGALAGDVRLVVERTAEAPPSLPGVTALTPVFDFGPDDTQFATEVAVAFTVTPAPVGAEVPLVFWTKADGSFAPLPTWWGADGKVHALTTHLSKAFVGRVSTVPDSLLCCRGVACAGRGVCLLAEPISSDKLTVDGQLFGAMGVEGRVTVVNTVRVSRTATRRATPVRPFEANLKSVGPVFDMELSPFEAGEMAELCVTVPGSTALEGTCLASFDEKTSKWACQDKCLTSKNNQLCGKTDHFTNFAILLSGGSSNAVCGR